MPPPVFPRAQSTATIPARKTLRNRCSLPVHNRISLLLIGAAADGHSLRSQVEAVVSAYCGFADEDWSACSYHLLNLNRFLKSDTTRDDDPVSLAEALVENLIEHGRIPPGESITSGGHVSGYRYAGRTEPYLQPAARRVQRSQTCIRDCHHGCFADPLGQTTMFRNLAFAAAYWTLSSDTCSYRCPE